MLIGAVGLCLAGQASAQESVSAGPSDRVPVDRWLVSSLFPAESGTDASPLSAPGEEGIYESSVERKLHNLAWFHAKEGYLDPDGHGRRFLKKRGLNSRQFVYISINLPQVFYKPRDDSGDNVLRG